MIAAFQVRADRSALWQFLAVLASGVTLAIGVVLAASSNDAEDHRRRMFGLEVEQRVAFRRAEAATTMSMMAALHDVVSLGRDLGCRAPSEAPSTWTEPAECAEMRRSFQRMLTQMEHSVAQHTGVAQPLPSGGATPPESLPVGAPPADAGP